MDVAFTYPLLIRRGFSFYPMHREGSGVDRIDVALLGLGTVGTGVYKMLQSNQDVIARRTGLLFEVKHILVRDPNKKRKVDGVQNLLTTRFEEIMATGVDVVMEAMGGVEPARTYIERAIRTRCHVVTANKELIAKHGAELEKLAQEHGVQLLYEASVGGGIPVLGTLQHFLKANRIMRVSGILNGTTNFILTQMGEHQHSFEEVLAEAQRLGYAEADPTADVEGFDAAHKLTILSRLAFGAVVSVNEIARRGITDISPTELELAHRLGYKIKLLAKAEQFGEEGPVALQVGPTLVPLSHPLSGINGVYNAIHIEADTVQDVTLVGQGAGEQPTASAMVEDLCNLFRLPLPRPLSYRRPLVLPVWEEGGARFVFIETKDRLGSDISHQVKERLKRFGTSAVDVAWLPGTERSALAVILRRWNPSLQEKLTEELELEAERVVFRPLLGTPEPVGEEREAKISSAQ